MTQLSTDLKFVSAVSEEPQLGAALEALVDALRTGHRGATDLAIVFATSHHAHGFAQIHDHLMHHLAPAHVIAITTEGVIGRQRELEQCPGLSILTASMPSATFEPLWFDALGNDVEAALRDRIEQLKAVVVLADPFSTPMRNVLPSLGAALPGVAIAGGMASGARKPGGNRLMIDGELRDGGAIALAVGGDVQVDVTVSQGCRAIGRPMVITKAKRNIILELGGRKALGVISEILEQLSDDDRRLVRTGGLLVGRVINEYKPRFGRGDFLIRSLMGYDKQSGYIAVNDTHVRIGQTVQLHLRDQQTAREDLAMLLEMQQLHGSGAGALVFSCNGRGLKLFDKPNTDADMIHEALGDMPLAGFFAAGEIGPVGGQVFLHGQTLSLMVFRALH